MRSYSGETDGSSLLPGGAEPRAPQTLQAHVWDGEVERLQGGRRNGREVLGALGGVKVLRLAVGQVPDALDCEEGPTLPIDGGVP